MSGHKCQDVSVSLAMFVMFCPVLPCEYARPLSGLLLEKSSLSEKPFPQVSRAKGLLAAVGLLVNYEVAAQVSVTHTGPLPAVAPFVPGEAAAPREALRAGLTHKGLLAAVAPLVNCEFAAGREPLPAGLAHPGSLVCRFLSLRVASLQSRSSPFSGAVAALPSRRTSWPAACSG